MTVQRPAKDSTPARGSKPVHVPNPVPVGRRGVEQAPPRRARRRTAIAVGSVIGTAIAGASAAALITPERVDQLFGMLGASGQVADGSGGVLFKTVADGDRAVSLEVPADWIVVHTSYDVDAGGVRDPGSSLLAGDGVGDGSDWGESSVYVGASTATAARYDLAASTPAERAAILETLAAEADWSIDHCLHGTDELALPTGFVGVSTSWDDCVQTDGMRLWEIYASSDDGAVFLFVQIYLSPGADASVAHRLATTLTVTRSNLPEARGGGRDSPRPDST